MDKARIFLNSSNSSFTECVRKHTPFSPSLSSHSSNNSESSCRDDCLFTTTGIELSTSATFTLCKWCQCKAEYGGGIYLSVTSSSIKLVVLKGEFHSCRATKYEGGGIYAKEIQEISVSNSLFSSCSCASEEDYGGAGIELWSIQNPLRIQETSFLLCHSANDAGGLGIWSSPPFQQTCILDCCFVGCTASPNTGNNDGGCLMIWYSNAAIGCSNTLFADSHSEGDGGAAAERIIQASNYRYNTGIPLFIFCFFKNNSAKSNPGNDVFFYEWKPTEPFLHCFSTTKEKRISYYSSGDYHFDKDSWLPQTYILVILSGTLSLLR